MFQRKRQRINWRCRLHGGRKEGFIMEKYCVKCGKKFEAVGREVICPACKAQAAEESKKAAVLKAKRASWTGESVPVRISGRASTVIRRYGAANSLPFAAALDALLQSTPSFQAAGQAWEDITPYKSHRRDKHATENTTETAEKQDTASKPQDVQEVKTASKTASKPQAAQAAKTSTSKKTSSKPSKPSSTKKG